MATPDRKPLGEMIDWQFTLSTEIQVVRYGTHLGRFWKQYLPGGAVLNGRFPPKAITQEHYEMAKRQLKD